MANKPVKNFAVGWVQCAIWETAGRFSATFKKRYKDKDGEYKDTTFFDSVDCSAIIVLGHQAATWIENQKQISRDVSRGVPTQPKVGASVPATSFEDDDIPF